MIEEFPRRSGRVICRFSCGAASAVATKLAIAKYGDAVEIFYSDAGAEHPDNVRFLSDCSEWFGMPITTLKSANYANIWEVFEARNYLVNPLGAPCTSEMKRRTGDAVWNIGDVEIYGYTKDEAHRVRKWQAQNPEKIIECPLIDNAISKDECFEALKLAGIELPTMYKLGFRNNNCIGCVKARDNINYWKRVRKHFPEYFDRMAKFERKLKFQINRVSRKGIKVPIYLDEIPPGDPKNTIDPSVSCGVFCGQP